MKSNSIFLHKIGDYIKPYIKNMTHDDIIHIMKKHYKTLCLMTEADRWTSKELEEISETLLPSDIDGVFCCDFIDEMVSLNEKNEYLMNFINQCQPDHYNTLKKKMNEEGHIVIPDVIGYTLALEMLTKSAVENHHVYKAIFYQLRKAKEDLHAFKVLPFFHKIKLLSVDKPAEKNFIFTHDTREVAPKAGGFAVKVNILEATWTDYKSNNKGNAEAGWVLAKNRCGLTKEDPLTGAGPSGWSDDGKIIYRAYPLADKWAELYQTWNMAFVTRFEDFPYIIPKLLIPQVAGFHKDPKGYIYSRGIALIIYLHFAAFDLMKKMESGEKTIEWFDEALNKEWGIANAEMAKDYVTLLKNARKKANSSASVHQ